MGASASVVDEELERKQNDIAYLGDRFPFGDAELSQLYRVYQQLQSNHTGPATSKCQGAGTDNSRSDETDNTHHGNAATTTASSFLKEAGLLSYQDVRRRKKTENPFDAETWWRWGSRSSGTSNSRSEIVRRTALSIRSRRTENITQGFWKSIVPNLLPTRDGGVGIRRRK